MNSKRAFYLLVAGVALGVIGLFGVGIGANYILTKQATKLATSKADNEAAQKLQEKLRKDKQDLIKYKDLNEAARAIVPQDKSQAQTVREIVRLAEESGISKLSSVTFPASDLGTKKTTGDSTAPSAAAGRTNKVTQATPVKDIPGVYLLPITITQDATAAVSYSTFTTFLKKLEQNRRTAQIYSVAVTPDAKGTDGVSFTIIINEYIKP